MKGCALVLVALALVIASLAYWATIREPGASTEAKDFAHQFRARITDKEIMDWATKIISEAPSEGERHFIYIPSEKWPSQFKSAAKFIYNVSSVEVILDAHNNVSGIIVDNGYTGIVIPWNEVIPLMPYFSIHRIDDKCPYFAFCYYK